MKTISDFITDIDSTCANITISLIVYELEAIHASSYPLTNSYHILTILNDDNTVTVIFEHKGIAPQKDIAHDIKEFMNSVVDHQLRLQLDRANGKIRDLIVAHAFSPLDLQKETECL